MKHYPHHISDFNNATRHLTRLERGLYRDLIDLYYETEAQLPLDLPTLCRKIVANECSTDVERMLNEFFVKTPTGWFHERCEEEISNYQANNSQRALAGKASAAKKALKKQQALNGDSTSVEFPLNEKPTEIHNQSTNQPINQEPIKESADRSATPRQKSQSKTLKTYLTECKAVGVKPLPPDHSIREYCADAQISEEMLAVAWCVFRDDYTAGTNKSKRYTDWPGHFANAVRGCWAKLWWTQDGKVAWTSRGLQEKTVLDARAKAKETTE